jgi:hypothetical protein
MEISNGALSLVECIESLKNDVKKKVKAIFTLHVLEKTKVTASNNRLEGAESRDKVSSRCDPHEHSTNLICEDW